MRNENDDFKTVGIVAIIGLVIGLFVLVSAGSQHSSSTTPFTAEQQAQANEHAKQSQLAYEERERAIAQRAQPAAPQAAPQPAERWDFWRDPDLTTGELADKFCAHGISSACNYTARQNDWERKERQNR